MTENSTLDANSPPSPSIFDPGAGRSQEADCTPSAQNAAGQSAGATDSDDSTNAETREIASPKDPTDTPEGEISRGKNSLRTEEMYSVASYADAICSNWRRGVEAFLEIGRLCAEADEQLDRAHQAELHARLPFSSATFSKFKKIGLDARLQKPEVQLLLPAAYTKIYAIACLNDEDLSAAITDKIINPDMKREKLEKWWKQREEAQRKADATDDATASAADSVAVAAGVAEPSVTGEPPLPPVETRQVVSPAPSEAMPAADADVTTESPSVAPTGDENIIVSDWPLLSADDQDILDLLNQTWDRASDPVRTLFRVRIGAR